MSAKNFTSVSSDQRATFSTCCCERLVVFSGFIKDKICGAYNKWTWAWDPDLCSSCRVTMGILAVPWFLSNLLFRWTTVFWWVCVYDVLYFQMVDWTGLFEMFIALEICFRAYPCLNYIPDLSAVLFSSVFMLLFVHQCSLTNLSGLHCIVALILWFSY